MGLTSCYLPQTTSGLGNMTSVIIQSYRNTNFPVVGLRRADTANLDVPTNQYAHASRSCGGPRRMAA